MRNLKEDFEARIERGNKKVFSSINGKEYCITDIKFFFFSVYKKIKKNQENIVLICDSTVESYILSIFFIFSKYDCYLLNSSTYKNFHLINNPFVIVLNKEMYDLIYEEKNFKGLVLVPFIEEFQYYSHPSFDIKIVSQEFFRNQYIGKSIFCSSGSTGKPKMIPLSFEQINACYNNVYSGFLNSLLYNNIIGIHDTSFVIILPFIFCLSSKKNAQIIAIQSNSKINPIIQLSFNINKFKDRIFISVPSIFRLLKKLGKNKFKNCINESHIIACGEPLDKKLAIKINSFNPKSFYNLYGSTEVAPWILKLDIKHYLRSFFDTNQIPTILPVGTELPNVELKISNLSELLVCAKSVFTGYQNQTNELLFKTIDDKIYYKTGDQFDLLNNLYFCKGRLNSSLKIAGAFVNPIFLEFEIKAKTSLENLILIPNVIESKLFIVILIDAESSNSLPDINKRYSLIKKIINSNSSTNIPTELIINKDSIKYLKSGKINRNYYKEKYIVNSL